MKNLREIVFDAISREREYQISKWGQNEHDVPGWLLIMEAELKEAKEAWVKRNGDSAALEEILQVVAVGVAALEQHGPVERFEVQWAEPSKS